MIKSKRNGLLLFIVLLSFSQCTSKIDMRSFSLLDTEGEPIEHSFFEGKVIFLNYWATWCGPCLQEMPSINRLAKTLSDKNIVFIAVSDEPLEKIQNYLKDKSYDFLFAQRLLEEGMAEMRSFPKTYILGVDGEVLFSKTGSTDWSKPEIVEKIQNIIAKR